MPTVEMHGAADSGPSLLRILWRRRWLIACLMVGGSLVGFALSQIQTKRYTAHARMFFQTTSEFDPAGQNQYSGDPDRFLVNQAEVMTSRAVLDTVIQRLNLPDRPWELTSRVTAEATGSSDVVNLAATADTPEAAKELTDAVAVAYRDSVKAKVAEQVNIAIAQVDAPADIQKLRTQAALYGDGVRAVEAADVPNSPSSPQPTRDALLLAIFAAIIGCAWTLFNHARTARGGPGRHAAEILGTPLLGEIPDRGKLPASAAVAGRGAPAAAAYTRAAMALYYVRGQEPGLLLVSGVREGVGASTTALNLAVAAMDDGHGVVLVKVEDALGRDTLDDTFGLRTPLDELADGSVDVPSLLRNETGTRVPVLYASAPRPGRGHQVGNVRRLMERLPAGTDLVVIDAPSLLTSSDSFAIAGQVDAVVAVVDDAADDADLQIMRERCEVAGVPIAGVICNHLRRRRRGRSVRPTSRVAGRTAGRGQDAGGERGSFGSDGPPGREGRNGVNGAGYPNGAPVLNGNGASVGANGGLRPAVNGGMDRGGESADPTEVFRRRRESATGDGDPFPVRAP